MCKLLCILCLHYTILLGGAITVRLGGSIITLYGGGGKEAFLYITKLVTKDTVTVTVIN